MFRLLFSKAARHRFPCRQTLLAFSAAILVTAGQSCGTNNARPGGNNDTTGRAQTTTAPAGARPAFAKDELYTLYLENDEGHEDLKTLLGESADRQKLICQFYRDTGNYLRLVVFASNSGNQHIELKDTIQPKRSAHLDTTLTSGQDLFFGDLQLADRGPKNPIRDLRRHIFDPSHPGNSAGWKYIWFIPSVRLVTEGSYARKYIVYSIKASGDLPSFNQKLLIDLDDANPSPPRPIE